MNNFIIRKYNKIYNLFNNDEIDLIECLIEDKYISDMNIYLLYGILFSALDTLSSIKKGILTQREHINNNLSEINANKFDILNHLTEDYNDASTFENEIHALTQLLLKYKKKY